MSQELRANLSSQFRNIARGVDAISEKIPDIRLHIQQSLESSGGLYRRPHDMPAITTVWYERMVDEFINAVQEMRVGRSPADMLAAFEKALWTREEFDKARESDKKHSAAA